jgi:hypothetical protein
MRKTIITALLGGLAGALIAVPVSVYAAHSFTDVPSSNSFHADIAWLVEAGVTRGCNPPANTRYCPDDNVTREQMAAFMRRLAQYIDAEDGTPGLADHATNADKAANSDKLEGKNSTAFAANNHDHRRETWQGSGRGLRVRTNAPEAVDAPLAGINTGSSTQGERRYGVYGQVDQYNTGCSAGLCFPVNSAGVYGRNQSGPGVMGYAGTNTELWQPVGQVGVVGLGQSRGVYGSSGSSYGIYGTSLNWYGIYGRTSRPDNNYGLYTPDNLFANNVTTNGAFSMVMQNGAGESLQPGDVVVFSGIGEAPNGDNQPVPAVGPASSVGDEGVAGVVLSGFDPETAALDPDDPDAASIASEPTPDGPVAPGGFLLVAVFGPVQVNVASSEVDALSPGELVTTDAATGRATGIEGDLEDGLGTETAAVLGKVLGPVEGASDQVWIFVTLN